jgi:urea transport system ATP-binding protein
MTQFNTAILPAPSDTTSMLKVSGLNVYYGESHILRNIDLTVPKGKMVCLIGRNGVGKTTLLKTIMGLLKPRSGNLVLNGQGILDKRPDQRARLGIGYVPQGREVIPRLTVKENLLLGYEARADRPQNTKVVPDEIFELFPVLETMLSRMGGDLSGGQQQQLAIARALMGKPQLLVHFRYRIGGEKDCRYDGYFGAAGGAAFAFCPSSRLVLRDAEGRHCGFGGNP